MTWKRWNCFAREHKLERIVAKRSDSRYDPGKRLGNR
jgi:ATP-dependent DNA ligase